MDEGWTARFGGDYTVKYVDVTSWCDGIKISVRISGVSIAMTENPIMIFKNKDLKQPILGL